jgi:hypothetical protein
MFKQKNTVILISVLALAMLAGCGQEQETTGKTISQKLSTKCSLGVINGERGLVVQTKTGKADFRGWAVDSNTNTVPELVNVVLMDIKGVSFTFEGGARGARPDVVKAYKENAFLNSGFRINADVTTLAKGTYGISLQMPVDNGIVICKTTKVLIVD